MNHPFVSQALKIHAHRLGPVEQQTQFLVEDKNGGTLPAFGCGDDELEGKQALAGSGRADKQECSIPRAHAEVGPQSNSVVVRRTPLPKADPR